LHNVVQMLLAYTTRDSPVEPVHERGEPIMNLHKSHRMLSPILAVATTCIATPAWALDAIAVPEPGTLYLLLGAAGVAVLVWRNRKK
jgi:hypothetical protein